MSTQRDGQALKVDYRHPPTRSAPSAGQAGRVNSPAQVGLMHLVDALDLGGKERVAVDLANLMPRDYYDVHLCTTRREGPLARSVSSDVGRLQLDRGGTIDITAIAKLRKYIRNHGINILHAHGTSLLMAAAAALFAPHPRIVWHDHFGTQESVPRSVMLYRLLNTRTSAIVTASAPLAQWARERLGMPADRVTFLPNFARENANVVPITDLPGVAGSRIVCVANLRPAKDHPTLLAAMHFVCKIHPETHLLLVGLAEEKSEYVRSLRQKVVELDLESHVSILGTREDVTSILAACDIGVLSSKAEGLPVSLLEYGTSGLPVVATRVGQCEAVLADGKVGEVVPAENPEALATALISLMNSPDRCAKLGNAFLEHVRSNYSSQAAVRQLDQIYQKVMVG